MASRLTLDQSFQPCRTEPDDELYPNGIFEFNITQLHTFVAAHPEHFAVERVAVEDIPDYGGADLDEETIRTADLSRPILLAEISPARFNVIDGHHRVAKARREGVMNLPAHRIACPHHLRFLTSTRAYGAYVEYWNEKLAGVALW